MTRTAITRPRDPAPVLDAARATTLSDGWMADAVPLVITRGGREVATVVVQNIAGRRAEGHLATVSPLWCHRDVLDAVFLYLRLRLGIDLLRIPIPRGNVAAQVAALKAGFEVDGVIRGGSCDGSDAILMSRATDRPIGSPRPRSSHDAPGPVPAMED